MSKFQQFFKEIYGDRWEILYEKLLQKDDKVLRQAFPKPARNDLEKIKDLDFCYKPLKDENLVEEMNESGLRSYYYMDPGSIVAARALNVCPEETVLDMCSAPGGKGLILIEALKGKGVIHLNEPSRKRRERLKKIIRDYIPEDFRNVVSVKGQDGAHFGLKAPNTYDRILVDAPCSGERHLIHSPSELEKWTPKRSKRLAGRQYGLLCSALLALKAGGTMVYSTCSISPFENDGVLEKLVGKKKDQFEFEEIDHPFLKYAEKSLFGYHFLPDTSGYGPLFITKIKKL